LPARSKGGTGRMSLRAFGRARDVSLMAVQKAIRSGRLNRSVGRDARGSYIADPALAEVEWDAGAAKPVNGGGNGKAHAQGTLVEAQLRVADQRAAALELANRRRRGELLEAAVVEREQFQAARMLRDRILNVPDRLGDLDPALRARLRAALREALGAVADELERE
jgi:phage terminase Nu1 subunit (DNA packaging protein)